MFSGDLRKSKICDAWHALMAARPMSICHLACKVHRHPEACAEPYLHWKVLIAASGLPGRLVTGPQSWGACFGASWGIRCNHSAGSIEGDPLGRPCSLSKGGCCLNWCACAASCLHASHWCFFGSKETYATEDSSVHPWSSHMFSIRWVPRNP